ncbi:hypothetical protein [Enterobacter kobei]|uniref:hypothetical protein n=1 Tax=Enterobacter kobei TaxID=208224 RepID=UPI0022F019A3|nr:hypothetical protein [Enterobacter kobei]ELE9225147.1 hypothetical protein [Enterobacter kobei]ELN2120389.1 hypothetical protein [Enterobacter kobei]MDA4610726.1 hypothetical protein [Enterobacter kobei]
MNENITVNFEVNTDASTPEKAALEINGLKVVISAIFTQFDPNERQNIINNIENLDLKNTKNILSILKSVHDSAK